MFDQGNITLDDLLSHSHGNAVVFHCIKLRFSSYGMDSLIHQIAFGGCNLTDTPVIAADIVAGSELTICIGHIGVNQLLTTEHTILCSGKRGIALGHSGFRIGFGNSSVPLFQDIGKALSRHSVPLNRCRLGVGNYITHGYIHFLQHIAGTDEDIVEICLAGAVCHSVFIYCDAGERGSVQMEGHTLYQAVLTGFSYNKVATFQDIAEGNTCHLTTDHIDGSGLLGFVLVIALFRDGIGAGCQVVDLDLTCRIGGDSLIDAVSADVEGNSAYLAVLRSFHDLCAAVADFQMEIAGHGVTDRLRIGDRILQLPVGTIHAIRPGNNATTLTVNL